MADIELVEAERLAGMLTRVHQMEAFLKMLASTGAAGLLVTNSDGEIVSCNDEIEQLFQWSPVELHGHPSICFCGCAATAPGRQV